MVDGWLSGPVSSVECDLRRPLEAVFRNGAATSPAGQKRPAAGTAPQRSAFPPPPPPLSRPALPQRRRSSPIAPCGRARLNRARHRAARLETVRVDRWPDADIAPPAAPRKTYPTECKRSPPRAWRGARRRLATRTSGRTAAPPAAARGRRRGAAGSARHRGAIPPRGGAGPAATMIGCRSGPAPSPRMTTAAARCGPGASAAGEGMPPARVSGCRWPPAAARRPPRFAAARRLRCSCR